MIFKKIILENFKSFQERTEIDIDLPREGGGKRVILIGGMNGGGKTAILEAINFCLYGARNEEVFERINRTRLRSGDANVRLELWIDTDEGHEVIISRSWRTDVVQNIEARDLREELQILEDGQRKSLANFSDFIDLTIPKGVSQFFFFDGEKIQYMASDVDSEGKLKSAMEAVLGIELVRRMHDDLKFIYSEDRRASQGISNQDIKIKEAELEKYSSQIENLKEAMVDAETELGEFGGAKTKKDIEFNKYFGFPPELSEKRNELERQRARIQNEIDNISKDIKAICSDQLPFAILSGVLPDLERQIDAEKITKKHQSLSEATIQLADQIVRDLYDPKCIACEREVPSVKYSGLKARINASISKILSKDQAEKESKVILGLSDVQEGELLTSIKDIAKETGKNLRPVIDRRELLERQLGEINRKARELTVSPEDIETFEVLKQELQNLDQNIGRKRQEIRSLEAENSKLEATKSATQKEFEELLNRVEDEKGHDAYLQLCQKTIRVVDEYIEELRKTKISELESNVFEMYQKLATHGDLTRQIRIDPDSFQITLIDRSGHTIPKENLSAGQKEIFAISLLWGLAQSTDFELPVVIDTPLSRLDSQHRENIINNYFANAGVQVIILSTDTEIDKTYFARLEPYVAKSYQLIFKRAQEITYIQPGYFWKN